MTGATPVMSKVVKTLAHATGRTLQLTDNDGAMALVAREHQPPGSGKCRAAKKGNENKSAAANRGPSALSSSPAPQAPRFHFMVIRPTLLIKDGPSSKRLRASKSVRGAPRPSPLDAASLSSDSPAPGCAQRAFSLQQPGPFSISTGDLADFILGALLDSKLYDSCPYVVSDSGF
jgi:hypothetical protein